MRAYRYMRTRRSAFECMHGIRFDAQLRKTIRIFSAHSGWDLGFREGRRPMETEGDWIVVGIGRIGVGGGARWPVCGPVETFETTGD